MRDNKAKFGLGLLIGALGGALAGILYAPKKGEKTRAELNKKLEDIKHMFSEGEVEKKAKEIFGSVTDETKEWYLAATKDLLERITDLNSRVENIDQKKYKKLVDDVISDFKSTTKQSGENVNKLRDYLFTDWRKFVNGSAAPAKKSSTKKTSKPKAKSRSKK